MLARVNRVLLRIYRLHQFLFLAGMVVLAVLDLQFFEGWATFWAMLCWAALFGVHFMIFCAQIVDDDWVKERTLLTAPRPWETGHIQDIRNNPFGRSIYRTELGRIEETGANRAKTAAKTAGKTADKSSEKTNTKTAESGR